ncbi:2-methylcitrate dehydratase [Clostridiales bacterium PH28_bin88]|nr:2-methylcitrate dehydratase [Clostridiales bacterium PH28_bin88]
MSTTFPGKTLTGKVAEYVVSTGYDLLEAPVVEMAKDSFMDWLGSALAGSSQPAGMIMLGVAEELGGNPQATLVPTGRKTSATNAALVNGGISHIVELDDVHKASILHPGAPVIPAALAAAELVGAGGKDLLLAIVLGYDVAIRIGEAVTPAHYYYWHTTATCGTFGAAAAAGKLLGLGEGAMVHALGSAGTQAAGLWEFLADGAMSKHLHPGKSAMNGLLSALLARKGFTGASRILEGERGFFKATAAAYDEGKVTRDLGERFKVMENCFKIHASCRHTHHAIDVVLELVGRNDLRFSQIESIRVGTYQIALNIAGNHQPGTVYAAKFSLPFCVSLAAKHQKAGLYQFTEEALHDPEIRGLMSRVELSVDPELEARYPDQWPARVDIRTRDGKTYSAETAYPKGDPENPVSHAELQEKFRELASPRLGVSRVAGLLDVMERLEYVADMTEVMRWLLT